MAAGKGTQAEGGSLAPDPTPKPLPAHPGLVASGFGIACCLLSTIPCSCQRLPPPSKTSPFSHSRLVQRPHMAQSEPTKAFPGTRGSFLTQQETRCGRQGYGAAHGRVLCNVGDPNSLRRGRTAGGRQEAADAEGQSLLPATSTVPQPHPEFHTAPQISFHNSPF